MKKENLSFLRATNIKSTADTSNSRPKLSCKILKNNPGDDFVCLLLMSLH